MSRKLALFIGPLLIFMVSCQPMSRVEDSEFLHYPIFINLVTIAPNATATNTPFQPLPNTPTATSTSTPTVTPTQTMTPTATATNTPLPLPDTLVGAGDISVCERDGDNHTSELLASIPGLIYTTGDNSNQRGAPGQYLDCFGYSWGRYMERLNPVPGNHDYDFDGGQSYFDYFGTTAGIAGQGWYSYEVGTWHIIALNSMSDISEGSLQLEWLKDDLNRHPNLCTLAYWHHPRWTSGADGSNEYVSPLIQLLYDRGVDVVVNGHDHIYERFLPQNPAGQVDLAYGIREFIAGTGGASHHDFGTILPNSEVRDNTSFGVLLFRLYEGSYDWQFIPVRGATFVDAGSDVCH